MQNILRNIVVNRSLLDRWYLVSCIALLALGLTGCSDGKNGEAPARKTAVVVRPQTATVTRYLYETGTTKAINSVDLVARVSGYLKSIDFKDGTEVKAGSRLFLIEQDQYQAQVQESEATVAQGQATLDNAQRQYVRQDQMSKTSATAETNVDNARATLDTSKAQLASSQASLAQARLNLGYTTINAPFDGYITEHLADVGALVGTTTTTLATIVQLDPIHVSFSISDNDMLTIRKQMRDSGKTYKDLGTIPVEIGTQIDKAYPIKGKFDYAAPETTSDTGTLAARAVFDNHDRALLPGLFVHIRIPIETIKDALLLPPSSIGTDQEGRFVLSVDDKGLVERRPVTLLEKSDDLQQVRGQLSVNDWIVQNVLSGAQPGDTVTKQAVAAATSSDSSIQKPSSTTPDSN